MWFLASQKRNPSAVFTFPWLGVISGLSQQLAAHKFLAHEEQPHLSKKAAVLLLRKECSCFSFSEQPKKGSDLILVASKAQVRFLPATLPKTMMNLVSGIFQWEIFQSEITSTWM